MSDEQPTSTTVVALLPQTRNHNLTVKVVSVKHVQTAARSGPGGLRIAECIVGDETGTVLFVAKNEQVDKMAVGSYLKLVNAKVDMFRGSMRLAVNKWGSIEDGEGSFSPKEDVNMSLIEFEMVDVEKCKKEHAELQAAAEENGAPEAADS